MAQGQVVAWQDAEGWGVIDSQHTPGGCWFHVSHLQTQVSEISLGRVVEFDYEVGWQDGYDYRATWVVGPGDSREAVDGVDDEAYRSSLRLGREGEDES